MYNTNNVVDLNPVQEPETVDLNPSQAPSIPSPSRAKALATRYKIALDDEEDTEQSISDTILSGGEGQLQERLVAKDMVKRKEAARSLIEERLMGMAPELDVPAMAALADTGAPYTQGTALSRAFVDKANDLYLAQQAEDTGVDFTDEKAAAYMEEGYMKEQDGIQAFSDYAKLQNVILEKAREIDDRVSQMGWMPWLDQQAMSMLEVPGWRNIAKNVPTEDGKNKWFVGGTLESTVTHIMGLPLEEASAAIDETLKKLIEGDSVGTGSIVFPTMGNGSLLDARRFIQALQSYSSMDGIFDTAMNLSVLPVGSAVRAGKGVLKEIKGAQRIAAAQAKTAAVPPPKLTPTQNGAKALNEAISQPHVELADVINATGRPMEGARARLDALVNSVMPGAPDAAKAQFRQTVEKTGILRPTITGKEKLDSTLVAKLEAAEATARSAMIRGLNSMRVSRLTPEMEREAAELGQQRLIENKLKDTADTVRAIHYVPSEYSKSNVAHNIVLHSYADGELFANPTAAKTFAKKWLGYKPEDFAVVDAGDKFIIEAMYPVDETGFFKLTPENTPKNTDWGMMKTLGMHPLGSKFFASTFQTQQRGAASHGVNALVAALKDIVKPIEALSKKEKQGLENIMAFNRMQESVPGSLEKGMFYQSVAEVDEGWLRVNKRLPTEEETAAYFSAVQYNKVDFIFRSVSTYRGKTANGVSNISIKVKIGEKWKDSTFEGRPADASFLGQEHQINFVLMEGDGTRTIKKLNRTTDEERTALKDRIAKGELKVIQANEPRDPKVLRAASGMDPEDLVDAAGVLQKTPAVPYFIVPSFETHNLNLAEQVGYRPGFHNRYKASHFVKQARVIDGQYDGDTTALGASNEAKGLEDMAAMEKGRVLLKKLREGDLSVKPSLEEHLAKTLGLDVKRFDSFFEKHLNINEPFILVENGKKSIDKSRFADGRSFAEVYGNTNNDLNVYHNPSSQFGDVYSAHRDPDLMEVSRGSEDNPVINFETANQFSPLMTQAQAMTELIKSTLFDDYQITAANNYIETFANDLRYNGNIIKIEDLRRNPVYFMSRATIAEGNLKRRLQAYQLRKAVMNLVGTPSQVAMWVDLGKQKLMSSIYTRFGEKYLDYVPDIMIPAITDPFQFLRSAAHHTTLGMFNPIQFFVQASSVISMQAISPKNALRSYGPSTIMQTLHLTDDPKIIEAAAEWAAKLPGGISKVEFSEAYQGLRETGFGVIGGEYAIKSSSVNPRTFTNSRGQTFLDKGGVFFDAGERIPRFSGWVTAYLDYLKKNPGKTGKMQRDDWQKVQNRAQIYVGNMTRDNNSLWQTGVLGNFSQFASYNVRMLELLAFKGGELTAGERMRLFATQASLFGFPPGAGVYAYTQTGDTDYLTDAVKSMNPFAEDMALAAKKRGFDMQSGTAGAIYNGILAATIDAATGQRIAVAERYGLSIPKVWEQAVRNYKNENPIWATFITLLGPGGTNLNGLKNSAGPITKNLYNIAMGKGPPSEYWAQDMAVLMEGITSVSVFTKAWAIMNSKPYRNKNGDLGVDTNPENRERELAKLLFGVLSQEDADAFRMAKDSKNMAADQQALKDEATKRMSLAVDAFNRGDIETWDRLSTEANMLLDAGSVPYGGDRMKVIFPGNGPNEMFSEKMYREWYKDLSPEQQLNVDRIEE